jgi:signal transduction histidine kinase
MKNALNPNKIQARYIFRNYYRIVYLAFGIIFLITLGLAYLQYVSHIEREKQSIGRYLQQNVSQLNNISTKSNSYLQMIRAYAENYLNQPKQQYSHPFFEYFLYDAANDYFHLDSLPQSIPLAEKSNLTGLNNFQKFSEAQKTHLQMALHLTPLLRKVKEEIKNSLLTYYYGDNQILFVNLYPYLHSSVFKVQPHYRQLAKEIYQNTYPAKNPTRNLAWTKIYVDEAGNGLMVSATLPVYKQDEFYGYVGVDLTLDSLNQAIKSAQRNKGELFIINREKQVLAHPRLVSSKDKKVKTLGEVLPNNLKSVEKSIFDANLNKPISSFENSQFIVYQELIPNTDWHLIYVLEKSAIYRELFNEIGLWLVFIVLMVFFILFTTLYFTRKYFIHPAAQLIQHLQNEQDNQPAHYGSVPLVWQNWFEVISHTFAENRQVLDNLKLANEELEQKVQERTLEIKTKNEELMASHEELKAGNEELSQQYEELERQREELRAKNIIIERQYLELKHINEELESRVLERTQQLTETNQSLIDQNNQLEQYAFITAHNLRSPVARVIGLVSIFDEKNINNPDNQLIIEKLGIAAEELDAIIKDLNIVLDVKKRTQEKIEKIKIKDIFVEVTRNLQREIQINEAQIKADFSEIEEVMFVKPYLRSIFYNLLSNALKYRSPERAIIVEVKTYLSDSYIILEVKDNGLGFNLKAYQNKVFQIYQRFHSHVTGKGMGLYLVKIQVESIGGKVELESVLNEGSIFKILIPNQA